MSSAVQRRDARKSANFHDVTARDLYARQFRSIGIAAVLAGANQHKSVRATPAARDIPAILRFGPEAE
ncbi:MAG: hypothetical protein HEQ16_07350 [Bosea sp.]|jgi:hypothetical protein|nr:hypothetical protein [Bosea sp. (in: a-proteobacteria)]